MFQKLYAKVDVLCQLVKDNFRAQSNEHHETRNMINRLSGEYKSKLDNMSKTITSQQRTIEQLTNALKDKYEHGLFIFSEDCKMPMVIRNGEEILSKFTSYFSISWSHDSGITMETEQFAGTASDTEE